MSNGENITRIRVQYCKGPSLRFTGHLDMQRLWERLLRRTKLPIRYSQGYHPRARLNLASALPLGFISEAELLDFWMNDPLPVEEVRRRLVEATLPGLPIQDVQIVDRHEDALQIQMTASEYEVAFFDPQDRIALSEKADILLAQEELIRTRRKKTYDLRPLILELEIREVEFENIGLWMRLNAEPAATGRPDEVLDALGFEKTAYLVKRTRLILSA
ncbi:MAG: TIGR03936 family radical SAM-associated protein [Chloroflexota bacterium]|nr:TIGR03936 family radical SAM-associated protein [Chloroflexota bacterium]